MTAVSVICRITADAPEFTGGEITSMLFVMRPPDWPTCADWQVHVRAAIRRADTFGGETLTHVNGRLYITPVQGKPGSFRCRTLPLTWGVSSGQG